MQEGLKVIAGRAAAVLVGVLVGIAVGISVADADVASAATTIGIVGAIAWLTSRSGRPISTLGWVLLVTFSLRVAAAVVIHAGSSALGRPGYVTGDDYAYSKLAWAFVRYMSGDPDPNNLPPYWASDAYLFSTWVYILSGVFAVFGHNIVMGEIANAVMSIGIVAGVADMARRLFGYRPALIAATLVALWPSLVLWSALTLKDTTTLAAIVGTLWSMVRLYKGSKAWLFAAYGFLLLIESLRLYMYLGLLLLLPIAVLLAPASTVRRRILWGVASASLSLVLFTSPVSDSELTPGRSIVTSGLLAALEGARQALAVGARTAIERTPSEQGISIPARRLQESAQSAGGRGVVIASAQPVQATGDPRPSCEGDLPTVVVPASAELVVVPSGRSLPPARAGAVFVHPCTYVVVVQEESGQPAAEAARTDVARRTLEYLPKGYAYALFAPFPWAIGRQADLLTIPEMLVWWVVIAAGAASLVRHRHEWRVLAPLFLFAGGTVTLLALGEGNVGGIFRHRAMMIPPAIVLASSSLARWSNVISRLDPS